MLVLVAYAGEYRGVRALAPPASHPRPSAPLVPPGRMCESWRRARAAGRDVYPLMLWLQNLRPLKEGPARRPATAARGNPAPREGRQ